MLHVIDVIEYFAKSIKVIEDGTIRKLGHVSYTHSCGRIFIRFDTMHERDKYITSQTDTARRHKPRLGIASRGKTATKMAEYACLFSL